MSTLREILLTGLAFVCLTMTCVAQNDAKSTDAFRSSVRPLLTKYCVSCHGSEHQKGERRFDVLSGEIRSDNDLTDYQDMLDQLNLSQMPPEEAPQPATGERQQAIDWLTARIAAYHLHRRDTAQHARLRRLNSREYRNTVRDLLNLNMTMFNPTVAFPRDQTSEHLDNVGDTLVTSGYLLSRYLTAADAVVDRALYPMRKPDVQTWQFSDGFRQQPEIDQVHRRTNGFGHITLYDVPGADKPEGAYAPIWGLRDGVPHDGFYEITFTARALNREHPYDADFVGTDTADPLQLGVVAGNKLVGDLHKTQPIEPQLALLELEDGEQQYSVRVWLDAGYTPRFTFPNGLMDVRNMWGRLVRRYRAEFPQVKSARPGIVEARFNAIKFGKLPQIHVDDITIKGPLYDEWPVPSQRALFGPQAKAILDRGSLEQTQVRPLVSRFASRAYRREATTEEVDRLMAVVKARRAAGRTTLDACTDAFKAALCSPAFLYHSGTGDKSLTSMQMVSRLSYFLWGSCPDQALVSAAATGKLTAADLGGHVDRMLDDPRSAGFVDGFLDSWLTLRDLGATPPDRSDFGAYYRYDLGAAMRRETYLFTRHLIDENQSVRTFLDSDFTFANKPLARLYGLSQVPPKGFHRVPVTNRRRGGLLGQASVLTVTANGVDTSPVVRGVWLLENLLGDPPSPPPPDVEPLDPDTRGTRTIRDQLKKHRDVPACYDCHRKIDPLGFALENFDPIGRWRDQYGKRRPVDASGKLPGGHEFKDVVGLKQILVADEDRFVRALTEKLLAYATGRHVTAADRPQVDAILREARGSDYGFRDLIRLVVRSEAFLR